MLSVFELFTCFSECILCPCVCVWMYVGHLCVLHCVCMCVGVCGILFAIVVDTCLCMLCWLIAGVVSFVYVVLCVVVVVCCVRVFLCVFSQCVEIVYVACCDIL